MADLDQLIDETLEALVSGAIEEGLIHSGQAGGSFVDLDNDAMLARLRDVAHYFELVLRGSPLVAEVERLRAAVNMHQPIAAGPDAGFCEGCTFVWPCPTVRAASGEGDRG